MRSKKIVSLLILICTTVLLALCATGCGVSEEEKIANRIMLGKYRLPSHETMEEDFEWVYHKRIERLVEAHGSLDFLVEYMPQTTTDEVAQQFISEAESTGVPLLQYVNSVGVRLPYYYHETDVTDPIDPQYYLSYTEGKNNSEAATLYLANLWNVKADEGETIKDAVIDYCIENSRIVYGYPNAERLIAKAQRRFGTKTDLGQTLYIIGEGGYAAVYDRDGEGVYQTRELESAAGDRIYGDNNYISVFRLCDSESWEYILSSSPGRLRVLKFSRWVEPGSSDYDAFVKIYGFEPKIHP